MFYLHAVTAQMERKLCIMPGCLWDAQLREPCYFCPQRLRTTDLCDCFSFFLHGEICWVDDAQAIPAQVWVAEVSSLLRVFQHIDSKTIRWQLMEHGKLCDARLCDTLHTCKLKQVALQWRSCNNLIDFWTHVPAYLIETQFTNDFFYIPPFISDLLSLVYPGPVLS